MPDYSVTISLSCSNSWALSRWCHPTISSFVAPFSSCPQSFPASGSFLMSWLFTSGSQSIGASASVSIHPMSSQGWFPLGWAGLISLQSKGTLKGLLQQNSSKTSVLQCWVFFMVQLSHLYMPTGKTIALIGLKHHVLLEKQTSISASRTTRVYNLAPLFMCCKTSCKLITFLRLGFLTCERDNNIIYLSWLWASKKESPMRNAGKNW